ncbi:MAG TPA: UDP-glucose 4-epimerase GalE [Acidobacteriota bacterium]|nr:UDP-glucose 4-epimerase GalE [Acidobacteriota bacterium]
MRDVLVTGGAGYIGSHAVRELDRAGYRPVTVDNLSEGHREAVTAGELEVGDLADEDFLMSVFEKYDLAAVMHFASRCYVGESVENPRRYYEENVGNALTLLRVMLRKRVTRFILSSTCATYGQPLQIPMSEEHPQDPVNPYGESKFFIERILRQYDRAYGLRFVSLRYFNAAGASLDAQIGEAHDPETHLIPLIFRVAGGSKRNLKGYGDDYPTEDGTCVRDYIHVVDLAAAHVSALKWLEQDGKSDFFNLGTGLGYSVLQMIKMAEEVTGKSVSFEVGPKRDGDPPELIADPSKALDLLGWRAQHSDLRTVLETSWRWETNRRY